jgi:peptidoglycan/LPS O-acetylase OafA/YrhL
LQNRNKKSTKLSVFYFKRFKRIIPSLISSSLFTLAIGYFNLSLEQFYELFRGLKYSILFVGNIFFAQVIDYFSVDVKRNLIVNLWSLSVEEQFYIIFPLLVIVAMRVKKIKISYFFIICFFVSLISYTEFFYNKFNLSTIFFGFEKYIFYSPFTRSSQFLVGAIAATVKKKSILSNSVFNYSLIIFMLFLFIFNFQSYNQVLISALIFYLLLFETQVKDNLYSNSLVHIGNISYSLYLFHQPILSGVRNNNYYATEISHKYFNLNKVYLVVIIFLIIYFISLLNYVFVEQTYRKINKFRFLNFKLVFIGSLLIIGPSIQTNMISTIYSQEESVNEVSFIDINVRPGTNYLRNNENELCINKDNLSSACKFGEGANNIYILGDSTISSLVNGFISDLTLQDYTITEYTQSGCYPVFNICDFKEGTQYYDEIFSVKNSIIVMGGVYPKEDLNQNNWNQTLNRIIDNGNKVVMIGYIPSPKFDELMFYKKNGYYLRTNDFGHYQAEKVSNANFKNFINNLNVYDNDNFYYVDTFDIFCETGSCNYFENKEFLFIDGSHLSYLGSKKIVEKSNLLSLLSNA